MHSGRPSLRLVVIACCLASGLACSRDRGMDGHALQVDVKGRKVVVPPPEGMADALSRTKSRPPLLRDGERIVAVYVPRDSIGEVNRPGFDPRWTFMTSVPVGNSDSDADNARAFARISDDWYATARRLADSTSSHLAAELELVRAGLDQPMPIAGTPPEQGWCLGVSEPAPNARELIVMLQREDHTPEVFCQVKVLVQGRVVSLLFGGAVSSVQEIAQVSGAGERWTSAVVAANSGTPAK